MTVRIPPRRKVALAVGSVLLSLILAELMARAVHHDAFPYLNIFEPDARYGVRLAAHATARIRSRLGRVTEIRTNALGFRGPEWPDLTSAAPVKRRILIVGDSQMLGYGVDQADALPAVLERQLGPGTEVLAAAVPTWGPTEYGRALEDLAPRYRPRDVIYVVNAANDWFETDPNLMRTTARDGWATAPGAPTPSVLPFRRFLLGRCHLVFAARRLAKFVTDGEPTSTVAARRLLVELEQLGRPGGEYRSPLGPALAEAARLGRLWGFRLTLIVLPLDVQVDPGEWEKHGTPPEDLSPTLSLVVDLWADARALGIGAVDLLPALRDAEPGVFLPDDFHLSPHGHRTVASHIVAIDRALRALSDGRTP